MNAVTWVGVALLGGAGAVLRFLLDGYVSSKTERSLPYGTFVINITGAFVLGLFDGLAFSGDLLVLAGTATVGSYTTFSTWMLETHRLREDAQLMEALANTVGSLVVGLGAVAFGHLIGVRL